jgi:single-strand DNA-binding protein
MINRVVLIGRITRDVELRYTQSGIAVGTFNLAVNRQFIDKNGKREADFIGAVIWRKAAENFANFTSKGSLVAIEGRLQTRNYEKGGQRIYVTEVIVDNFSLLESRSESEKRRGKSRADQHDTHDEYGEAEETFNNADPFVGGQEVDISDDDLPF